MTEVHLPRLEDEDEGPHATEAGPLAGAPRDAPSSEPEVSRRRSSGISALRLILEVMLIAMGVFLGLAGEQWREGKAQRENAMTSLRQLRSEVATNRDSVQRVKDYHATTRASLRAYLQRDAKARQGTAPQINGIQPVPFEHTAWDLALSTQAFGHIDSDLAFSLSRIYNTQQSVVDLGRTYIA